MERIVSLVNQSTVLTSSVENLGLEDRCFPALYLNSMVNSHSFPFKIFEAGVSTMKIVRSFIRSLRFNPKLIFSIN